jgi:hypothetical protein
MARRPTLKELRFLFLTATQNLQFVDPTCNATSLASLKRVIDDHIAALEFLQAIERPGANGESGTHRAA